MPLVINSLGSRYTHANKHTLAHTYRYPHRNNFKKPGVPACGRRTTSLKSKKQGAEASYSEVT